MAANSNNPTKENGNNAEFDSQRQDLIKEATAKGGAQKVFGGGTKEIKEGKSERRGGRSGRGRDNNRAANDHENSEEPQPETKGIFKVDFLALSSINWPFPVFILITHCTGRLISSHLLSV